MSYSFILSLYVLIRDIVRYYVEEFKKAFSKPQPYETEAALQIVKVIQQPLLLQACR